MTVPKNKTFRAEVVNYNRVNSKSDTEVDLLLDELIVPFAQAVAACGFIVTVSDCRGLGDNYNTHPYCHTSVAYSVWPGTNRSTRTPAPSGLSISR